MLLRNEKLTPKEKDNTILLR